MITFLFSFLFLAVGIIGGWLGSERYLAYITHEQHEFEDLFEANPHPELFDDNGNIFRGEYFVINFPPDFDPERDGWFVEEPDEEM